MAKKYDFAGWATKNDVRCADGRIIRKNAFIENDGKTVPLFWNHQHGDPEMVLGHALLVNKDDGVYAYGSFNDSPKAQHVKESIAHGDLLALSIYANQLKQDGSNVLHGIIRELSVVPGGANPDALIETAMLAHGDIWDDEVLVMNTEDDQILMHTDVEDDEEDAAGDEVEEEGVDDDATVSDVLKTLNENQKKAVAILIDAITNPDEDEEDEEEDISHSADEDDDMDDDTVAEVLKTLNDDQKKAVAILIDAVSNEDEEEEEDEEMSHSDMNDILDTLNDEQAEAVAALIESLDDDELSHSDMDEDEIADVLDTLDDEQAEAVANLIDSLADDEEEDDNEEEIDEDEEIDDESDDYEEDEDVKHNVFDTDERYYGPVLSHSDMQAIFEDWKRVGSLKEAVKHQIEDGVLAHTVYNHDENGNETTAQTYGIADINYLFPEARTLQAEPEFISRQMDWVKKVMNGTRHTPFSRVKSVFADITMEEARAKGYTKGNLKVEEVFALLKRVTTPQTIYKTQKLDRDDIIDITDFNVVAWIKAEMRMMLEEECARAILIGDGRSSASADKISEDHIRPIWKDDSLYTIRAEVTAGATDADTAAAIIKSAVKARKDYKGSGNTVMFTTAGWHTEMALLEDKMGRPLYDTDEKLRNKMRVNDIIDVEPMENLTYNGKELAAIVVDLRDYNVGADKGGEVNFFDDFDLDYNREKYLIETRFSGALVKPYSAIVLEISSSSADSDSN